MATALGIKGGDERPVEVVPSFTFGTSLVTPLGYGECVCNVSRHTVFTACRSAVTEVTTESGTSLITPTPMRASA
jgi:hypothetical protein